MRPGIRLKGSTERVRVRAMRAKDGRLRESEKSTSHSASIPTERRYAKPVPTPSQSSGCAHEGTRAHEEMVRLAHEARPARKAKSARETMKPSETGPAREARPMREAMHAPETGYADEGWTGSRTTRSCEAGPSQAGERTREVDAGFEWIEDLAEHLKTMGKDKIMRDLLARDDGKKSVSQQVTRCTIYTSMNYHLAPMGKNMILRYMTSYIRWTR